MGNKRRRFTREFKIDRIRELESGKTASQIGREHNIHPTLLYRWKKELASNPDSAFKGNGNAYKQETKIAEYERLVGRVYAENDFLIKALDFLEKKAQEEKEKSKLR